MPSLIDVIEKYFIKPVDIQSPDGPTDLGSARNLADQKVREIYPDAMLLAWYEGKSGKFGPRTECDFGEKPAWMVYAETRGADLTIVLDGGEYVFIYNTDPVEGFGRQTRR